MNWKQAKLYGGPLDGAQFELDYDPPPQIIYVLPQCSSCGGYHHAPADSVQPLPEAQTYKLKREDHEAGVAHYGHGDIEPLGPDDVIEKVDRRDLVGV